jgi:uncharacterized membrane protein YbhN (UPF0104 family)
MKITRKLILSSYLWLLAAVILLWCLQSATRLPTAFNNVNMTYVLAVIGIYSLSHLFRIMRLALLTLDQRSAIMPLIACHAITALPSALLPFKIGEIIRLSSFFYLFRGKKGLAVWLAERFADITVISAFIFALYFFNVDVPAQLRTIFILFLVFSVLALMAFFAVSKVFIYLNRYLVLSSSTPHGLKLLKISHQLKRLEESIFKSFEGRFVGIFFLSVFIWLAEIAAMALFLKSLNSDFSALSHYFLIGLSAIFYEDSASTAFILYKDLVLLALGILFGVLLYSSRRISRKQL